MSASATEQFYRATWNADAVYSDENSVCASVKRVHCDKTEEKSVQIFIPYERSFSLVFWEEEWLMGRPLLFEILGPPAPVEAKSPILNFARSASVVTPSEKSSINTNGSPLRAFQWDQNKHHTLSLSPQREAQNAKCPKFEQ